MKCPSCNANFSELRDLCPSCLVDLRGFKRQNGLAVSYPAASYDALLKKIKKENEEKSSPPQEAWPTSSATTPDQPLKTIYSKPAQIGFSTDFSQEVTQDKPLEKKSFLLKDNPDDPSDAAEVALNELLHKEFLRQQEKLGGGQDSIIVDSTESPFFEPRRESDKKIETTAEALVKHAESVGQDLAQEDESPLDLIHEIVDLKETTQETENISRAEVVSNVLSTIATTDESTKRAETLSSSVSLSSHFIVQAREESNDMSSLFQEAISSLSRKDGEIELSLHQIAGLEDNERIRLLFDLSYDSFLHPNRDLSFLSNPDISRNSGLELLELRKSQEKIVFHAPTDALPPLRSRQRQVVRRSMRPAPLRQVQLKQKIPLKNASVGERLVAFLIDGISILMLGLASGLFLSLISSGNFELFMVQLVSLHPLSIIHVLRSSILGIALMSVVYPLITLRATGTTLGFFLLSLKVEREDTADPGLSNIIVRSCTFPLTLLLLGPFPIFPGERFLHDYLGRVIIGRRD